MRKVFLTLSFVSCLMIFASLFASSVFAKSVSNTVQQNYQWRNDNGGEAAPPTGASYIGSTNQAATNVSTTTNIRLRISVAETNAVAATVSLRLEYGTNSNCSTGMVPLDTSTTTWQIVSSTNFANLDQTTAQIGSGTPASPIVGYMSESSNPVTGVSISSSYTESEWNIRGINAASNTTYYFRVTNNGTPLNSVTNCAQLTTATPPAPTQVVFTNASRTLTAGTCSGAGSPFTIQLQDAGGTPTNPTGTTVINVSSNSSGTVTFYSDNTCGTPISGGNITFTTSDNTATFYVIDTKTSSPTWTLTAHKSSGPDTILDGTQGYTVNPGVLDNYLVTVSTTQTAGVCFTGTNTITARDANNNTVTTDSSVVDMTTSGTGINFYSSAGCSGSTTQYTLSSGTITIYVQTTKKQTFTITATKHLDTPTGTSSTITVNPNSMTRLVVTLPGQNFSDGSGNSGSASNRTAGQSFAITQISATDDYSNVVTSYTGNGKTLAYSGPSNAPDSTAPTYTTTVDFSNGISTNTLTTTLYKAEAPTITVTDGGSYGYASSSVTVDPGNISADTNDSSVTGTTSIATDTPDTITITLKDTWRNPISVVPAADITLASTGGGESITQPSSATDANGQTTGNIQWSTTGSKTVSAAISVVSLVQNDGSTPDADGILDNTLSVTVSGGGPTPTPTGGATSRIKGNMRIKGNVRFN